MFSSLCGSAMEVFNVIVCPNVLQTQCSSSFIRSCTTDTFMLKSAWVTVQYQLMLSTSWPVTEKPALICAEFHFVNYCFLLYNQGGPTLDQRFESYYNYCNLFNYILSKFQEYWIHFLRDNKPWKVSHRRVFVLVNRCWWPSPPGAAKPVAVGHHWWVHLPGKKNILTFVMYLWQKFPITSRWLHKLVIIKITFT